MVEKIKQGAILIEEGTPLPDSLAFESEPYSKGWRIVKNLNGYELEQKTTTAGWNLFHMAVEIKATVFGFDEEEAVRRAINRILTKLRSGKFNCLEITQVGAKRFLGLPYVTVSAHPRHIQESVVLFRGQPLTEWDSAQLASALSQVALNRIS